jgi:hypothetical protein
MLATFGATINGPPPRCWKRSFGSAAFLHGRRLSGQRELIKSREIVDEERKILKYLLSALALGQIGIRSKHEEDPMQILIWASVLSCFGQKQGGTS